MSLAGLQSTLLGTRLTLYLGPMVAVPAPFFVIEALQSAVVEVSDEGRDGFELTFSVGRGFPLALDYKLPSFPLLRPGIRVILQLWFGVKPQVLIDGYITRTRLVPSNEPGGSTYVVTGEDLRVLMDLHEVSLPYPNLGPEDRINTILARYVPFIGGPPTVERLIIPELFPFIERICAQSESDFAYVQRMARRHGNVFYIEPTPVPMVNTAYWGPENRTGLYQAPLRVNQGPETNVTSIDFTLDALTPHTVLGAVQDKRTPAVFPIVTLPVGARVPLAPLQAAVVNQPFVRTTTARDLRGLDLPQALARAQAQTDASTARSVQVKGTLDTAAYHSVLKPRRKVQVAGAGLMNNGDYYVRRVRHEIRQGGFTQSFVLTREGQGPLLPLIVPTAEI
jgi:hypothetical protein